MDLKQIREARTEMENTILEAASNAAKIFREKTGLSPSGIQIDMADITTMGQQEREFVVAKVRADVSV